jgi:hypothetical protein
VPCDPDALITAINLANAHSGATLSLAGNCTYTLTTNLNEAGLPVITQPITIDGNNATLIRAANATAFRIFEVATGGNLTLQNLTVTGGRSVSTTPAGGGIHVRPGGAARLIHTTIKNNSSVSRGGGIYNDAGMVSITDSVLTDNSTGDAGGAIFNFGSLTINSSNISNNFALRGGAVFNAGAADINDSSLTHNRALGAGGGVYVDSVSRQTTINHSTISDNSAVVSGGGIHSESTVFLRNSTVSGNNAAGNGGGVENLNTLTAEDSRINNNTTRLSGGGIFNGGPAANVTLRRSDVIGNQGIGPISVGGGIANVSGTVALFSSRVDNNTSTVAPGGIFTNNGQVTIDALSVAVGDRPTNCSGSLTAVNNCFG